MAKGYPKKNKKTPLTPVPPKGLVFTELDKLRYAMYLKHHYGNDPPKNLNDYTRQFRKV